MQKKITTAIRTQESNVNKSLTFSISITCIVMGVLLASIVALRKANIIYMTAAGIFILIGIFMLAFAMREEKPWTAL
ncbi:hypothetical protein HYS50_00645 [Candidatus Woesearchaeota archaeon]|nr:hypothetical protein [Candidatus Woesearchaeota archaeon]